MDNYVQCYEKKLRKVFEEEENKDEGEKDQSLKETMYYINKFFDQGGYEFLKELETSLDCAGLCYTPLFYLTKDVRLGQPTIDCASATVDAITNNKGASIVFLVTGLVLLLSIYGAILLCKRVDPKDE